MVGFTPEHIVAVSVNKDFIGKKVTKFRQTIKSNLKPCCPSISLISHILNGLFITVSKNEQESFFMHPLQSC